MPALDQCHHQVVRALQKAGWIITNQPYNVSALDRQVYVDVRAVQSVNGHREQILLLEVKCFLDKLSITTELYIAVGQYIFYRTMLKELNDDTPLYLSVPETAYVEFFDEIVRRIMRENRIKLLIVDLKTETIVRWIE
ncbi:MAG: fatty-acid oxidation protein subunit alpha [Burkholderiales bacterium]|nr:fatty-acid oxidation protein subunit alpha [Anaerolineae bacterium]